MDMKEKGWEYCFGWEMDLKKINWTERTSATGDDGETPFFEGIWCFINPPIHLSTHPFSDSHLSQTKDSSLVAFRIKSLT